MRGSDAQHVKALRIKLGEKFIICDGEGTDCVCRLHSVSDAKIEAVIEGEAPSIGEPTVDCRIIAAVPKGDRADYLVQKCTEAGASSIVFFLSVRCVSRPEGKSLEKKLARWQRIADEAAKQAGRGRVPRLSFAGGLDAALDLALKSGLALFMYETGERVSIKQALQTCEDLSTVSVITGPEGGFEPFEADLAAAAGLTLCSMGPRILRCETAPLCALTALMYQTDNL